MLPVGVKVGVSTLTDWGRKAANRINDIAVSLAGYLPLTGGTLTGDLSVPDEVYGVGWNGSLEVPTKNALYDKIETLGGGGGGTTTNPLTMNNGGAGAASGTTFDGSVARTISYNTVGAAATSHAHAQGDLTGLTTADSPQFAAINLGHASDTTLARVSAGVASIEGVTILTTATGQPLDATLTALAAYNTNGVLCQTAADTFAGRTLTAPAAGLTISNPAGIAGNPTFALANDLSALEALAGTNTIYYRSAADTWTAVAISNDLLFSGGTLGRNRGTSFPGSPSDGDIFWRSDLNLEFFYKSSVSRWLTTQLFLGGSPLPAATTYIATTANQHRTPVHKYGLTDVYMEKVALDYIMTAAVGNWTCTFNFSGVAPAGAPGTPTITVASATLGSHYYAETSVGAIYAACADVDYTFTENSGAATFFPMPSFSYRLAG